MTEPIKKPFSKPPARDPKSYFAERAAQADIPKALEILEHAGVGNPPETGDEISDV